MDITLYHHSFYQTDGFQHPITIDPYSGKATTQDYLVEGQYILNFVLLVQPFDVISGSITVDVINNLGTVRMYECVYKCVWCMEGWRYVGYVHSVRVEECKTYIVTCLNVLLRYNCTIDRFLDRNM